MRKLDLPNASALMPDIKACKRVIESGTERLAVTTTSEGVS